jgi:hypothetical protein
MFIFLNGAVKNFFNKIFHRFVSAGAHKRTPRKPSAFAARVGLFRTCGDIGQVISAPVISRGGKKLFQKNFRMPACSSEIRRKIFWRAIFS